MVGWMVGWLRLVCILVILAEAAFPYSWELSLDFFLVHGCGLIIIVPSSLRGATSRGGRWAG